MLHCPKCLRTIEASHAKAGIYNHRRRLVCPLCGTFLKGRLNKQKENKHADTH